MRAFSAKKVASGSAALYTKPYQEKCARKCRESLKKCLLAYDPASGSSVDARDIAKSQGLVVQEIGRKRSAAGAGSGGYAGAAADAARPLVAAGAAAAGKSRTGFPQATSYLGRELANGLSKLGKHGQFSGFGGIALNLYNGNYQDALYSGVDYFVYSKLAEVGAAGSIDTLGESAAIAGSLMAAYYAAGGSQGIVESTLGCD